MDCLDGNQNETTRELSLRIKNCTTWHQQLKRLVKTGCARGYPEQLNSDSKEKVRVTLVQTTKSHRTLKEFFRPYLEPSAVSEVFWEDKVEALKQRNSKLKQDRASFEKQVWELSKSDEIRHQTYLQLQKRCQELEQEIENFKKGEVETAHKRRQQQLEETLKAQNDLIEDLEWRLSDSTRENEILRQLNKNLEVGLRKRDSSLEIDKLVKEPNESEPISEMQKTQPFQNVVHNLNKIEDELKKLFGRVSTFSGKRNDYEYINLRELLIKNIFKLDRIQTNENPNIGAKVKGLALRIQEELHRLDSKSSD